MKKVNQIINTIIGAFAGVFVGHGIYVIWDYNAKPELYAMQSAPWYTSILMYGLVTLIVFAVCILLKIVLKYFSNRPKCKATE